MDRRNFLKKTGLFAGATLLAPGMKALTNQRQLDRIGIQLYTLRTLMAENVQSTLRLVSDLGYKEVEFAGYFEHDPKEIRSLLDSEGITAPSAHVELSEVQNNMDSLIEAAHVIGHTYIVMPWLQQHERQSLDQFKEYADLFNKAGEKCNAAGITFAYHNHMFEFEALGGEEPYELLLRRTDADLMKMQLDLYWTVKAERDPIDYFKRFPGRFPLCHVKDLAPNGDMVNVGKGTIDFARIFAESKLAGLKHYFVEHDQPADAALSSKQSIDYLKTLSF